MPEEESVRPEYSPEELDALDAVLDRAFAEHTLYQNDVEAVVDLLAWVLEADPTCVRLIVTEDAPSRACVCLAAPGSGLPRKLYAVTGILDDVRHAFVVISIDQKGYDLLHRVPPDRWASILRATHKN